MTVRYTALLFSILFLYFSTQKNCRSKTECKSATMETPSKHHKPYGPVMDAQYQTKDECTLLLDRLSPSTLYV